MTIRPLTEKEKAFREEIKKSFDAAANVYSDDPIEELTEEMERIKTIIAGLEWVDGEGGPVCIICGASKNNGHNDGCWLGRSIKLILGND